MDAKFWHSRWQSNKIGFHEGETNALLAKHFNQLNLKKNSRIFLPLCGKTKDIEWLLTQGYQVAGIELSETAVEALFDDLGASPNITRTGKLLHFSHENLDIYAGDIFDLSTTTLGPVDVIYDRAALVALPPAIRNEYTSHLAELTHRAPQFLICFEYDQSLMEGPPFSVDAAEVNKQYAHLYNVTHLATTEVVDGLRQVVDATETVWLLQH